MQNIDQRKLDTYRKSRNRRHIRHMKSLRVGSGNTVFGVSTEGIWLGAKSFKDAPFKVNMFGVIEGINLDGQTITGATIKTNDTNTRLELNGPNNKFSVIKSGVERLKLEDSGIFLYTETGQLAGSITGVDGSGFKKMSISSGVGNAGLVTWESGGEGIISNYTLGGELISIYNNSLPEFGKVGLRGAYTTAELYISSEDDGLGSILSYLVASPDLIPTSNPGGSNRIWNDGGTLKIT